MLTTFVIGLREGLEAALIVSIIATYLRRNGLPQWPMWCGVSLAVLISIGVGVALQTVEQSLPQAKQEGMESIIGVVAVVFVTAMIVWMGKNARGLKSEIEHSAIVATSEGTGWALALMAFLAVVKEGFETSVFLLATLHASTSATTAASGAVIGITVSCVAGYLLYTGGARLNLGLFFTVSGVFLVFVAGGLLLTAFRTAHGAGWVNIGQQRTVDLSWLSPIGSIRSALFTGVLGIPADPRVIEVTAWLCYTVPVLAIALWPRRWRPVPSRVPVIKFALAGFAAVAAIVLPLAVPAGEPAVPTTAALTAGKGDLVHRAGAATKISARVTLDGAGAALRVRDGSTVESRNFPAGSRIATNYLGVHAEQWTSRARTSVTSRPAVLTIDQLAALFGRVPVGISNTQDPGPYDASWVSTADTSLWMSHGGILDLQRVDQTTLTLTGGGLAAPRILTLREPYWSIPSKTVSATSDAVLAGELSARNRALWRKWLPLTLAVVAAGLTLSAGFTRYTLRRATRSGRPAAGSAEAADPRLAPPVTDADASGQTIGSTTHAVG